MTLADFIPSEGQRRIADAITAAERHTTGEICVHVTPRCRGKVVKRAIKTFNRLHLYNTKRRNAVLIFVAYEARKLAILGDTGINEVVPKGFWNNEVEELTGYLKAGRPVDGLCEIIAHIGDRLSEFFRTKVQLNCTQKGKGKISITFNSEEELERIMNMFDKLKD